MYKKVPRIPDVKIVIYEDGQKVEKIKGRKLDVRNKINKYFEWK